mmetsp:Transcript_10719/g.29125  ORF Transcript_10719/g.29125 Transcript_10719/m.29125 type:complete len:252 (+) Transcript_10719:649-1404(+)
MTSGHFTPAGVADPSICRSSRWLTLSYAALERRLCRSWKPPSPALLDGVNWSSPWEPSQARRNAFGSRHLTLNFTQPFSQPSPFVAVCGPKACSLASCRLACTKPSASGSTRKSSPSLRTVVLALGTPLPLRPCAASLASCTAATNPLLSLFSGLTTLSSCSPFSFTITLMLASSGRSAGQPKNIRLLPGSKVAVWSSNVTDDLVVSDSAAKPGPMSISTASTILFLFDSTPRPSRHATKSRTSSRLCRRR